MYSGPAGRQVDPGEHRVVNMLPVLPRQIVVSAIRNSHTARANRCVCNHKQSQCQGKLLCLQSVTLPGQIVVSAITVTLPGQIVVSAFTNSHTARANRCVCNHKQSHCQGKSLCLQSQTVTLSGQMVVSAITNSHTVRANCVCNQSHCHGKSLCLQSQTVTLPGQIVVSAFTNSHTARANCVCNQSHCQGKSLCLQPQTVTLPGKSLCLQSQTVTLPGQIVVSAITNSHTAQHSIAQPLITQRSSRVRIPLTPGFFSRSSHTSDFKIGTPVAILPGAWCYRVSAGTGLPGVSML